ncbi:MAG TPA: hypothetical protein VE623_02155 [Acidimicrobiales bacterium]|nr:hypothetical protein [Acidimicrobiales bacterium]
MHPVGDGAVGGVFAGGGDRDVVEVEPVDAHLGVRFGNVDLGSAFAAPEVGDPQRLAGFEAGVHVGQAGSHSVVSELANIGRVNPACMSWSA